MPKHHSEDYKVSAVKHYLNKTNNLTKRYHLNDSRFRQSSSLI